MKIVLLVHIKEASQFFTFKNNALTPNALIVNK